MIGRRERPVGWASRTTGAERYVADVQRDDVLVTRILRSRVPHGRILVLDPSAALSVPGVAAVITARDFPEGVRYLHLDGDFSDRRPLADGVVRYVGEEIAAVAAETPTAAAEGLRRIRLRIRPLPAPLTVDEALAPRAPTLHERPHPNQPMTLLGTYGDLERGNLRAAHEVADTYAYPAVAHACMEPHSVLAAWDDDRKRLEIWASTQSPHFVQREVAHVLGLRAEQVVCREVAVGGGFGVKSKIAEHEVIAAKLAMVTGRSVRCVLTRAEEFSFTKTRHATRTTLRLTCDEEGLLRLVDADVVMDNGAYNHYGPTVLRASVHFLGSMYRPKAVRYRARLVDTAKPPGGPFRGYGVTQTAFALESSIDELAHAAGIDPVEIRLRNATLPGSVTLAGARVGTAALTSCLEAVRDAIGWDDQRRNPEPWRGIGIAAGMHGSGSHAFPGSNRSEATVELDDNGRATVRFGSADAGTGQRTVLAQIVAEELGVAMGDVTVVSMDGEATPFDMGSWSSRGTHYTGHATRVAARQLADHLRGVAAEKLGVGSVALVGGVARSENGDVGLGDVVAISPEASGGVLTVHADYTEDRVDPLDGTGLQNKSASYPFAAHAAEVEVNPATGKVTVVRYVAAHDVGTPLNPTLVEGQIRGGVAMGLGAALGEEVIHEQGRVVNASYLNYALPRAADLPHVEVVLVGDGDDAGPYGAKSVGEIPLHPVAPAVANAVFAATGLRITDLPITPDKILRGLAEREGRQRSHRLWRRPGRWWITFVRWSYPRGVHQLLHRWGTRLGRRCPPRELVDVANPDQLRDASSLVAAGGTPVGGGTDLLPRRDQGLTAPDRLVALGGVSELTQTTRAADGSIGVGAAVTLEALARELRGTLPLLGEAIDTIASPQIRAVATVGGNLLQEKRCWFLRNDFQCYKRGGPTCPCYAITGDHRFQHAALGAHRCQAVTPSDLATVLVALDATVVLGRAGAQRRLPVAQLYTGPGETCLGVGELLETIRLPAAATARRQAFRKLRLWQGDFAVVSAAVTAQVDGRGRWYGTRIVLGAVGPTPWRARRTERALEGQVCDPVTLRRTLDAELDRAAHPLQGNAWKLDAAVGLALEAAEAVAVSEG